MKKIILLVMTLSVVCSFSVCAEELKVGMKAPDWTFKDSAGKDFSMASWDGKVLLINYVDPDKADLNEHFTEAMKKAKNEGRLTDKGYKGIGIADCAATWKPDFLIRKIAGKKAKKYKTVILFDYDASLRKSWGFEKNSANAVILDRNRICRAIIKGRVPDDQVEALVQLAIDLQNNKTVK